MVTKGFIEGWSKEFSGRAGKTPRLYVLIVPGEWSPTTVQFLVTSSSDCSETSFYKNVVASSPFRQRNQDTIVQIMDHNRTLTLYTKLLAFSVSKLLKVNKAVYYNARAMQVAFDAAIGFVPRLTHWVSHATCKTNHRSIRLDKQLVDKLKKEDEIAVNMVSDLDDPILNAI